MSPQVLGPGSWIRPCHHHHHHHQPLHLPLGGIEEVEAEVHREFDREVPSEAIGRLVATKLRGIDQISYIRYASEYYNFETLGELEKEIGTLREQARELPNQEDLFG